MMDLQQIERLRERQKKGLQLCLEKIQKWEKFKSDYEALRKRLETLPDSLSYDVTVPFGPNAFTKGKIVHTNEVMVLLGDNWFAEVSAKQAVEIATRRIDQCNKTLLDLRKEEKQFSNWLNYIGEVADNENLVEIVETYDPEKESEWREQHARNVKAYHQKLAEGKGSVAESTISNKSEDTEKDYTDLLEDLEIKESQMESEKDDSECQLDDTQNSDDSSCTSPNSQLNFNCCDHERTVSESEEEKHNLINQVNTNGTNLKECNCSGDSEKHVRWQDLSKQNIKKITFKHSRPKNKNSKITNFKEPLTSGDQPQIQSPSDIYQHFGNLFQAAQPKSILKVKSPPIESVKPFFPTKPSMPDDIPVEISNQSDKRVIEPAFTGKICERTEVTASLEHSAPRTVSHFKSSRKNRRK